MNDVMTKYITELTNLRAQLEFEVLRLRSELEEWTSGRKQAGSDAGAGINQFRDLHQVSTSAATPGSMSQGSNTMVDTPGGQVPPVSPSSS